MSDQQPHVVDTISLETVTPKKEPSHFQNMSLKERAVNDYWAFIDLIEFRGGSKNFASLHREMVEFVTQPQLGSCNHNPTYIRDDLPNKHLRRLMLVPRGHLKSTLCCVGYALWRIYRNPNLRICVATATKDLALQFVREIKQYLEDDEKQETVWNSRPHVRGRLVPILDRAGAKRRDQKRMMTEDDSAFTEAEDKKIVWRSDAIQVMRSEIMKEPTVIATSPGSNITGMHFDLVIMDDIINDDIVATLTKMDKLVEWSRDLESVIDPARTMYLGQVGSSYNPATGKIGVTPGTRRYYEIVGDEVVIVGTRYAKGDFYEYLIENLDEFHYKLFFRNIYTNGRDNTDGYIWSEKFNDHVVQNLKTRQKPKRFASQYLNSIMAEEDIVLRKSQIKWLDPAWLEINRGTVSITLPMRATGDVLDRTITLQPILFIDPAISQKKEADNTVIMVGGVDADRNLYILDYEWGKMLPMGIVEKMFALADKWGLSVCHLEVVAFQQVIGYMIKQAMHKYRPVVVKEYRPKGEKKGRITSMLEPYFANNKIWMMRSMASNPKFMEEIDFFPQETVSDDFLDVMAMIVENCVPTVKRTKHQQMRYGYRALNQKYGGSR